MALKDLHTGYKYSRAISPAVAVTNNTAFVSQIATVAGFDSLEFVWIAGSIADADVTFTLLMEHGDASDLSDATAASDLEMYGTEASAAPLFGSDNKVGKIGYKGTKGYVRVTITPAGNTGDIYLAAIWVQGHQRIVPQTTQVV